MSGEEKGKMKVLRMSINETFSLPFVVSMYPVPSQIQIRKVFSHFLQLDIELQAQLCFFGDTSQGTEVWGSSRMLFKINISLIHSLNVS